METLLDQLSRDYWDAKIASPWPDDEEYSCPICGSSNRRIHSEECEED